MVEEHKNGISVITCSIKPELCNNMIESIKNTIGTNFETIVFDNREQKLDICQVYNNCAQKAKFPYLCFIHEDIIMSTPDWGKSMIAFADKTPDCGVIGFAGGTIATKNFLSWVCGPKGRYRYYAKNHGGKRVNSPDDFTYCYNNPDNEEFANVITLDGLFLFASKKTWQENPFDAEKIKGFHFYDADFSFGISRKKKNYVCLTADIYHLGYGNRDRAYYESAKIFQKKWKGALPCNINGQKISIFDEFNNAYKMLTQSIRHGFTIKDSIKHFLQINGLAYLFTFCVLLPVRIAMKVIGKIKKIVSRGIQQ